MKSTISRLLVGLLSATLAVGAFGDGRHAQTAGGEQDDDRNQEDAMHVADLPARAPSARADRARPGTLRHPGGLARSGRSPASRPVRVTLASGQTHRCLRGHPWVFRSELGTWEGTPVDGGVVQVLDRKGAVVGSGFYSARSQIAVRLVTRGAAPLDDACIAERLRAALAWRTRCAPDRAALRLVHSEADGLPGLIVDRYADRLVVQATTVGIDQRLEPICAWLRAALAPTQIVERNDLAVRALEGLPERSGVRHGPADTVVEVAIGRVRQIGRASCRERV